MQFRDVTSEQYYCVNESPPYNSGKKSTWYGWKQRPQQITINLMKRVLGDRTIEEVLQKF